MVQQLRTPHRRTGLAAAATSARGAWLARWPVRSRPRTASTSRWRPSCACCRNSSSSCRADAGPGDRRRSRRSRRASTTPARRRARASPTRSCASARSAATSALIRERTQDTDTRLRSLRDEVDALRATLTALQSQITQLAQAPAAQPRSASTCPSRRARRLPARDPAAAAGLHRRAVAVAHARLGQVRLLRRPVDAGALGLRSDPADVPAHRVGQRGAVLHRRDPFAQSGGTRRSPPTRW